MREDQLEEYRAALGDRVEIVEVSGGQIVYWDAYDETAAALGRFLENPRAERGGDELDRELGGGVLTIEDRIDLDDVEANASPDSATSSRARCASRYERPPRTGVPTPGAPGSRASMSRLT